MTKYPRMTTFPYRIITVAIACSVVFAALGLGVVIRAQSARPTYGCLQYSEGADPRKFVDVDTGQPVEDGAISDYVDPIHFTAILR
jgi:hypothetical protein